MRKLDGKGLLELGTSVASVDIVKYAKSEGAYVIVTDYLPAEKSEAKQYADETAMVSTLDVDALTALAREKKVDGIFCGVSEANLLSVQAVAERLGLPCYFTMEQWDICQNKKRFKQFCEQNGIPTPREYPLSSPPTEEELKQIRYPVIVKPVDQGAGVGIHICRNEQELMEGYRIALEKSASHTAIVEDYLPGEEFSATYTVCNGEFSSPTVSEKHLNSSRYIDIPVDNYLIYPGRYLQDYMKQINDAMVRAMRSIGFKNGSFFVQGLATEKGLFIIEMGLRLNGGAVYKIIDAVNGVGRLDGMVNYALTGHMDIDVSKSDANFHGKKCCELNVLCRSGKIGAIEGTESVTKHTGGVFSASVNYRVGDEIPQGIPLRHRFLMAYIAADSWQELAATIDKINATVKVFDENGVNMVLRPADTSAILCNA